MSDEKAKKYFEKGINFHKEKKNDLAKKSFVEKFLNSIKSKMYRNK